MLFNCLSAIRAECRATSHARRARSCNDTDVKEASAGNDADELFTRLCRAHQLTHHRTSSPPDRTTLSEGTGADAAKGDVLRARAHSDTICAIDASREDNDKDTSVHSDTHTASRHRDESPLYALLPWMVRWSCLTQAHEFSAATEGDVSSGAHEDSDRDNENSTMSASSCHAHIAAVARRVESDETLQRLRSGCPRAVVHQLLPHVWSHHENMHTELTASPSAVKGEAQAARYTIAETKASALVVRGATESTAKWYAAAEEDSGCVRRSTSLPTPTTTATNIIATRETEKEQQQQQQQQRHGEVHNNVMREEASARGDEEAAIQQAAMSSLSWPPTRPPPHHHRRHAPTSDKDEGTQGGSHVNGGYDNKYYTSHGNNHVSNSSVHHNNSNDNNHSQRGNDVGSMAGMRRNVDAATPRTMQESTLDDFFAPAGAARAKGAVARPQSSRRLHFAPIQTQAALLRRNSPPPSHGLSANRSPTCSSNCNDAHGGSQYTNHNYYHGNNNNSNSGNNNSSSMKMGGSESATSSGGFVSASDQLLADVKAGRAGALASSLVSARSPALGLRRNGFQPPFHSQPPPPSNANNNGRRAMQNNSCNSDGADVNVNRVLASMVGNAANNNSNNNSNGNGNGNGNVKNHTNESNDANDASAFPASLLLPDGTVPPLLQPLDPQLVSQVAAEILEGTSGKTRSVTWDDIAGLQYAKDSIEEAIVWPLRRPDLFVGLRDPPRGLLLFGPPGTGKTMIARAIAHRAECTFLNISASSIMSKWVGDGEKLVRCLFAVATVRQPSVIFVDEIDSLLSARGEGEMESVRRVKTEFLVHLDGVATDGQDRVLLIGATNRPDELDEAARRRLEKRLYIPLPDAAARRELIARLLFTLERDTRRAREGGAAEACAAMSSQGKEGATTNADVHGDTNHTNVKLNRNASVGDTVESASDAEKSHADLSLSNTSSSAVLVHTLVDDDLIALAELSRGYSGADLKLLCREASMGPLREIHPRELGAVKLHQLRPVGLRDFKNALRRIRPSVGAHEVTRYESWNAQYGSFNNSAGHGHADSHAESPDKADGKDEEEEQQRQARGGEM